MDQKSIAILKNLREYVGKDKLNIDNFPQNDIMSLVHEENQFCLYNITRKMSYYEYIYQQAINYFVGMNKKDELLYVFDLLIEDLEGNNPIDVINNTSNIQKIEKIVDELTVEKYKKYVREIYESYGFEKDNDTKQFEGKGVIYTVITGDYDLLREPKYVNEIYDYICFTNNKNLTSDVWKICYIENDGLDNVRLARKYKILCHRVLEKYDYSIYVDGKMQIIGDIRKLISNYSRGRAMLCFPHFVRKCCYKEAEACIEYGKDDVETIKSQMERYVNCGYPRDYGLVDTACLIRQHKDKILQSTMEDWWKEVRDNSIRDQLSIGYACWKNNFQYDISDLFIYDNEYICKRRDREKPY